MSKRLIIISLVIMLITVSTLSFAQDRQIIIPKSLRWTPLIYDDTEDLFGKAWRYYREGFTNWAADSLRKLITEAGFEMKSNNYYIVVPNFTPSETPIGMFHGDAHFHDTRMYGLDSDSLYYIFISRDDSAKSYLSTEIVHKSSRFEQLLPHFISLFPIFSQVKVSGEAKNRTWIDIRKYEIPEKFRKNCDISIVVKKEFYDDTFLARTVFDNTSLEKWSFGIATAVTNASDVDFIMDGGTIVVRPKPRGDLATFGLINYHFKPVDTKAKNIATSFHLLGGLRISQTLEPIFGVGFGIPISLIDLHLFAGYSVEFAETLADGFSANNDVPIDVDPFKLKVRGKLRFGIEVKFP